MPSKSSLAFIMIFIITSTFAVIHQTRADADQLILPSSHVTIEAFDSTISYFETKLTDVPSGYDVTNRTYPGWCIDQSAEMERSPTTHSVLLYSSLSPPGGLVDMEWDKVNYVLNHKQGGPQDVQQAIWNFINMNGGYSAETDLAQAMVAEAEASGTGFIPEDTQVMAVICDPLYLFPGDEEVQVSIIEVTVPSSGSVPDPTPTPTPKPNSSPNPTPTPVPGQPTPTPVPGQPTPTPVPGQPTPTPYNPDDNSSDSITLFEAAAVIGIMIAIVAGAIVTILILRKRKK
jgi:hypothetical protein